MTLKELKAFELVEQKELSDIHARGTLLKHKKSGARILLMENDDTNKVFTIGFRTPPTDSTGLPHIMEHSVLCGSRDFPLKDPFVELVKGSLNTFLNAMTYPDKTLYPVASCNDKDFQNLMHVYMDAVFYPNIYKYEEIFCQEGWSYKLENPEDALTYNGVVYNEMKGAFSSPEGVLDRMILNSLFPDNQYSNESGGDPENIPDLTYAQFLDFHRNYYHPSNSYIYLYGQMDMVEKLIWLDEHYLSQFAYKEIDSEITYQKPFDKIKEWEKRYSITAEESEENNTFLSYNKVIGTSLEKELCWAFMILDYALLSAPGAPLKKALIEAGIGKDILGSYDDGVYQPVFSVVAKHANKAQKAEFVKVIENTLVDIVQKGVDQKAILAGINYYEFRFREADFGSYPKGLIHGLNVFNSWLYDENHPFMHLELLETFEFLKGKIADGYYEKLIQTYLLDNMHGSIVVVVPEKGQSLRLDNELKETLNNYKKSLSEKEIAGLVEKTQGLEAYQEAETSLEDLEKIPVLARADISPVIAPIYNEEINIAGIKVVHHDIETNGIGYITMLFDLGHIPEEELVYVGILQAVLGIIDTNNYPYAQLYNEINVHTGGIGTSLELYSDVTRVKEKKYITTLELKGKALYPKMDVLLSMMREILMESKFNDEKRLKEILSMLKSRLQMYFQSSGHIAAAIRALSYASPAEKFKDDTDGIGFYQKVKEIEEDFDAHKDNLMKHLQDLARKLFTAANLLIGYTAPKESLTFIEEEVKQFKESLYPDGPLDEKFCTVQCAKHNEGFKTSSKVQYVARVGNFIDHGVAYHGVLQILKVILSYDYLWQNVRVKGGAYGCMSDFAKTGKSYFMSYRDPHLARTNEVYEGVVDYLKNFTVSERDMVKYIIGTFSNLDRPMNPSANGERSMNLYMNRVTAEMIQKERTEIIRATQEDVRAMAAVVEAVLAADQLCVIGSEEKIEEAKELFDEVTYLF
ncbi:MAG: insulinase family protein [Lachnospiraceae bacterium]|nr:insulinase family protein [Lachnospiraceae bacterium]